MGTSIHNRSWPRLGTEKIPFPTEPRYNGAFMISSIVTVAARCSSGLCLGLIDIVTKLKRKTPSFGTWLESIPFFPDILVPFASGLSHRTAHTGLNKQIRLFLRTLLTHAVLPLACWGWWWVGLSDNKASKLVATIKHCLKLCPLASKALLPILVGHQLDPCFMAGQAAFQMWKLAHRKMGGALRWLEHTCRGMWQHAVNEWLTRCEWTLQEPGKWVHSSMQHVLRWNAPSDIQERDKHMLRESWRRALFSQFLTSARRDASQLCNTRYCEQVCQRTRVAFADGDAHVRAVLAGGACSDQHLAVMTNSRHNVAQPAIQCKCSWCNSGCIGDWDHQVWHCAGFSRNRPPVPDSRLQRRLGWLVQGTKSDHQVMEHMAGVRALLADSRHTLFHCPRLRTV